MIARYDYHRPRSLDEALALKAETPEARFLAGGTDLLVRLKKRVLAPPPALISLRSVTELHSIRAGDELEIGGMVTLTDLIEHSDVRARWPVLVDAARCLGSHQIRNAATVAGNLCNASPCADMAPPLLVLEARVGLAGPAGSREMPLEEFFQGPGLTALQGNEILTAIRVPPPPASACAVFLRKGRVHMDLAMVNVAVLVVLAGDVCGTARVAAGAVAPTPLRLREVEALVTGSALTPEVLERAGALAARSVAPISDLRSSAEYRRDLTGVLVKRALRRAAEGE